MSDEPNCRRLRFSLRTLLVVVTIFCAWLGYQLNWIHQRREARKDFTFQLPVSVAGDFAAAPEGPRPPFPLWLFGEKGVGLIMVKSDVEKQAAQELFPESQVCVNLAFKTD